MKMNHLLRKGLAGAMVIAMTANAGVFTVLASETGEVKAEAAQQYLASEDVFIKNASADQANLPFAPELYYSRQFYDEEGQRAWDYLVKELLKFNPTNEYKSISTDNNGIGKIVINLPSVGLDKVRTNDVYNFTRYLVRNEPRMFHIKDWPQKYTTQSNGYVDDIIFYIAPAWMEPDRYQNKLKEIERNVEQIIAPLDERMTDAQRLAAIYDNFAGHLVYKKEGSCSDINGVFTQKKGICGGYAKGFEYLALRSGIKAIWVEGYCSAGYHAWNNVEVDGEWYFVDSTWDDAGSSANRNYFLLGEGSKSSHKPNNTFMVMPTLAEERVNLNHTKFPTVDVGTEGFTVQAGSNFDPLEGVRIVDIYGNDLSGNARIKTNMKSINKPGVYDLTYVVTDNKGYEYEKTVPLRVYWESEYVSDIDWAGQNYSYVQAVRDKSSSWKTIKLYNGIDNTLFDKGVGMHSVTTLDLDVEGKGYKYFESYIGVDRNLNEQGWSSVVFKVIVDGEEKFNSGVMRYGTKYRKISVDVEGAKKVQLVLGDGGNGIGSDHGSWGEARFLKMEKPMTEEEKAFAANSELLEGIADIMREELSKEGVNLAEISQVYVMYPEVKGFRGSESAKAVADAVQARVNELGLDGKLALSLYNGYGVTYEDVDSLIEKNLYLFYQNSDGSCWEYRNGQVAKR